ncbi:MAG: beta-galactosidase, partial [Bacteroidales bacterium]|nr:beta-galactosidase [Bacteroidales bacterium]
MKCVATLLAAFLMLSCTAEAQPSGGNLASVSLNSDWQFCKGDSSAYAGTAYDDSAWRVLDLPHDWGVEGPFVQSYPGETGKLAWWGTAWYRRHLRFPFSEFSGRERFLVRDIKDARYWLDFDGVMSGSTVYVNGHPVGGRPYGYSSFRVEIGQYLVQGDNVIAVRVDNKPNSSRWYPGGGI